MPFSFTVVKGQTRRFRFLVSVGGVVQDVGLWDAFAFTAKFNSADTDAEAVFRETLSAGGITVVAPSTDGYIQVELAPADGAQLEDGKSYVLPADLWGTDGTGQPYRLDDGEVLVPARISRSVV